MKRIKSDFPRFLPCGQVIESEKDCCKTICSTLSNYEIEKCYAQYKKAIIPSLKEMYGNNVNEENWYIFKDIYFSDKVGWVK